MTVPIAGGNGGESLQPIAGDEFPVLFDGEASHQPAQDGGIGFMIIGVILIKRAQQLLRGFVPLQIPGCLLYGSKTAGSAGAAGGKRQNLNPSNVLFLIQGGNILTQSVLHGFLGDAKVHPFDGLPADRQHHQGKQQGNRENPLHILTSEG